MSKKIHPSGITPQKPGPTMTCNDPLTMKNGSGKKTASNGVVRQSSGTTFGVSNGAVNMPNADKTPPATKVKSTKDNTVHLSDLTSARSYGGSNGGDGRSPSVK